MEMLHKGKDTSPDYLRSVVLAALKSVPEQEVPAFIATVNQCVPPSLFQRMFWGQVMDSVEYSGRDVASGGCGLGQIVPTESIREGIKKAFENGITAWEAKTGTRMG